MVVQLRLDERLIHGQVAAAWARALDMTHIVCASDAAVKDTLRTKVLLMTAPPNKKVFVKSVDETIRLLSDPRAEAMKIFLITDNPRDAVKLVKALHIQDVNVANYHKKQAEQKVHITDVCVTDAEEIPVLEELVQAAGSVYSQMLPTVDKVEFQPLIEKAKANL